LFLENKPVGVCKLVKQGLFTGF